MPIGAGISSQLMMVQETTPGTQVTVTRALEFNSESLKLNKTTVDGAGLHAGGQVERDARAIDTTREVKGDINFEFAAKGFGILLQNMLGSFGQSLATPTLISTTAYKQVHQTGATTGKAMTIQVGVPQTDGTVKPFTYVGCKVDGWEFSCATGGLLMLSVTIDAMDELTLVTSPASQSLASPTYATYVSGVPATFSFQGGTLLSGGTASTTTGLVSIAGGATLASIKSATVKCDVPLASDRYFFGNAGTKAEQVENAYRQYSGTLVAEFTSQAAVYDLYRAGTSVAMQLTFTGPANSAGTGIPNTLDIVIPKVRFLGESPAVGGPGIVELSAGYKVRDDGTNAPIQVALICTDTVL